MMMIARASNESPRGGKPGLAGLEGRLPHGLVRYCDATHATTGRTETPSPSERRPTEVMS